MRAHGNQGQAPDEETERTEEEGEQRDLHKLKRDGCETACTGTRDTQCVYVPYVLSVSLEFLRAVARVCGVHVSLLRMWCSA